MLPFISCLVPYRFEVYYLDLNCAQTLGHKGVYLHPVIQIYVSFFYVCNDSWLLCVFCIWEHFGLAKFELCKF